MVSEYVCTLFLSNSDIHIYKPFLLPVPKQSHSLREQALVIVERRSPRPRERRKHGNREGIHMRTQNVPHGEAWVPALRVDRRCAQAMYSTPGSVCFSLDALPSACSITLPLIDVHRE